MTNADSCGGAVASVYGDALDSVFGSVCMIVGDCTIGDDPGGGRDGR